MLQNNPLETTLHELISIQSISGNEAECINYIENTLQNLNFDVTRIPAAPNRDNLIAQSKATQKSKKPTICFYGHVDTVEPDPAWKQNPFSVTTSQHPQHGRLAHGLGVADMKGAIAAMLQLARWADQTNIPLQLAFGVDEEQDSIGSHALVTSPIAKKFFAKTAMIVSGESGQVVHEQQDFAVNYGRKGRIVVHISVKGVGAHAARSDIAVNAIHQIAQVIQSIQEIRFSAHAALGEVELVPFMVRSHTDSFSIPDTAEMEVNVLTVPGVSSKDIITEMTTTLQNKGIKASVSLKPRAVPYMESYQVDTSNKWIRKFEDVIFNTYSVQAGYAQSVADENRFAHSLGIPVISVGPIGGGDHTASEWVRLSSLHTVEKVYQEIALLPQKI